jgi:hypothetical protein
VAFSSLSGGLGSALSGGDFWKGAAIGAMVGALNHAGNHINRDSEIDILEDSEGAEGHGHMAIAAGNDKKGWKYVSKYALTDQNGETDGGLVSGGKSLTEFKTYHTRKDMLSDNSQYEKVIRFSTTYRNAMRAIDNAYSASLESYHVLLSNCAQAVAAGLNAAGIYSGWSVEPKSRFEQIQNYYHIK